jgi:uncharacterized protein
MIPFHLAFPVNNLEQTRYFYGSVLGCQEGRSAERWIDFNFFGHQISAHLQDIEVSSDPTNIVDGDQIPIRHFGAILPWAQWQALGDDLKKQGFTFLISPKIRFKNEAGEQGTFFLKDPSGNVLEFKSFQDMSFIFSTNNR